MELGEDQARVIKYFLKSTPVGEHSEVLKDLKSITGSDPLASEFICDALLESLSAHGHTITHEGTVLQLTTIGRNGFQFFDPKVSATFTVNPQDLSVSDLNQVTSGTSFSRLIQEKLDVYLSQHFSETAQGRVFQNDEGIYIFISSPAVNLRNLWTGEWIGDWKVGEGVLEGTVNLNAHYFEEGNLQMAQKKEFRKNFGGNNEETWAEEIVKAIKECDNVVQTAMDELYENVPQTVFKSMRRTLPVTHTKFIDMHRNRMFS